MGLFVYLFKRYMLDMIREKIAAEKQTEKDRSEKVRLLKRREQELVQSSTEQECYIQYLIEKAQQWQQVFVLEQEKRKAAERVIYNAAMACKRQQTKAMEKMLIGKQVMPQAIDDAHNQLEQMFTEQERGREYIEQVLAYMEKNL